MKPIKNSYLVELNFPAIAANQRYYFPDIPKLRNVKTTGLEAVNRSQLTKSPTGKDLVTSSGALNLILTLVVIKPDGSNEEVIYQQPYYSFTAANNGGIVKELKDINVNLTKSYITIVGTTGLTAADSAAIIFYF